MDTSKIIKGVVGGGRYTVTAPIVKEDYGLYLKIEGLELPTTYEVDFSNSEHNGTSVTMIGNADGVLIPSQFIKTGKDIFAFLYHVGVDYGRTVYKFRIPNKLRPDRTDEQPTPEEQSLIDQAISALNSAVEQTAQDVIDADASAQSASTDADRASANANFAHGYAEQAEQSAQNAHASALQSSASATASAQSASQAQGYAQTASQKADAITGLTAQAETLPSGSSASASYDAETGVMTLGIPKGTDGTDGISPTVTITPIIGGHRITITDADGEHSADVMDGTGSVDDVQINGSSIVVDGVANVPLAENQGTAGVVKIDINKGIYRPSNSDILAIAPAISGMIKQAADPYRPITPRFEHEATFYGLAKAAGHDEVGSALSVGTYTEDAKSKISEMLGGSVAVSGTTPTITAKSGIRYVCGEVATLDLTLPASGIVDVVFESGATATVLTITGTVKWANGFDPTTLDPNTTYEINIMDGLGVCCAWT